MALLGRRFDNIQDVDVDRPIQHHTMPHLKQHLTHLHFAGLPP